MRGKGRSRQFHEWRESSDRCRDGSLLFLFVPGSSLPLAQLHGRPHVSKTKHAAGAATVTSVSINQPSLAIAYPFLSPSLSHTDMNQGLDQEGVVTGVQNEKRAALLPQVQTDSGGTPSVLSKDHSSVCSIYLSLSTALEVFKGKSLCLHLDTLYFFVKGRKEMQCAAANFNVGPLLLCGKSLQDGAGYLYVKFRD